MAKFSVGRLEEGEGPSSRTRKRQRSDSEPQAAVNEEFGEEELDETDDNQQEEEEDDDNRESDQHGGFNEEQGAAATSMERSDDAVGPTRTGAISVTLDPDVLDCFVCFDPLTIPVFQCENGHVACSSCCSKLRNICPSCCSPIGYNRCRAIEKVLESVTIKCKNRRYGCKETMSFSQRLDHEKTCHHAPCFCPLSDCCFVGSSCQLYRHFTDRHSNSAVRFQYNKVSHVTIKLNEQFLILQAELDGFLFILHNDSKIVRHGSSVISVSCIAPSWMEGCFYDIMAKPGRSRVRFQSYTSSIDGHELCPPLLRESLLVPSSFFDCCGQLKLDICIWRYGQH